MATAILYGAGSGALHAVTGPDHVLSLGPAALRNPGSSFRIGLLWGVGHALGTLLLAVPLVLTSAVVHLPALAAWGERAAGVALLAAVAVSWWSARRSSARPSADVRPPLAVGAVHGITGAGSLLLLLPVLVAGSLPRTLLFLAAFSLGSAAAMALLTSAIARLGARLQQRTVRRLAAALQAAAVALAVFWLL